MGAGNRPWLLRGAVVTLAVVVGSIAWLVSREEEGENLSTPAAAKPRIVNGRELGNTAAIVGHRVYWAGPIPNTQLELTEGPDGNVQVRYLKGGAEPGDAKSDFLAIGSYPLPDPAAAIDVLARRPGSTEFRARDGRRVVVYDRARTSVYFASPDNSVQVEVYDLSPRHALKLALSSRVRPAG
jgi:hypothetical protein